MADITSGTGADSPEDIKDEAALASVGVDPDTPLAAGAEGPGQDDEDEDEFDEDEADEDDEEEDDEEDDSQQASDNDVE